MGHKNYHNYSKPFNKENEQTMVSPTTSPAVEITVNQDVDLNSVEAPGEFVVKATTEPEPAPELPTTVIGFVSGCKKLNVRNKPSTTAAILTTIGEGTEVVIAQPVLDDTFYKVTLANGTTGYCMKKFITVK